MPYQRGNTPFYSYLEVGVTKDLKPISSQIIWNNNQSLVLR